MYPSMWQIITGTLREQETAVQCAFRELTEETSLRPRAAWVVPAVDTFYEAHDDQIHSAPVFAFEVERDAEPVLSHEHQRHAWLEIDDARKRLVWPGQRNCLEIVREYIVANEEAGSLSKLNE